MARKEVKAPGVGVDPRSWLDLYGDTLYRYALVRLGDTHLAEDMVQETLLAALQARKGFEGRSSLKTWLFGILKHKVVDLIRKKARELPAAETDARDESVEALFNQKGKWERGPSRWGMDPASVAERKEFWEVFRRCLSALPPMLSEAFLLREMDRLGCEEICKVLETSTTNIWVMLHRARVRLRECLEAHWFAAGPGKE